MDHLIQGQLGRAAVLFEFAKCPQIADESLERQIGMQLVSGERSAAQGTASGALDRSVDAGKTEGMRAGRIDDGIAKQILADGTHEAARRRMHLRRSTSERKKDQREEEREERGERKMRRGRRMSKRNPLLAENLAETRQRILFEATREDRDEKKKKKKKKKKNKKNKK